MSQNVLRFNGPLESQNLEGQASEHLTLIFTPRRKIGAGSSRIFVKVEFGNVRIFHVQSCRIPCKSSDSERRFKKGIRRIEGILYHRNLFSPVP